MATQTCISIGINQYQSLPALGYGLADAVAMEQFFIDAAGWSPSQCLLMTDTSPHHGDKSTYPDRENINRWLQQWSWDTLHHGDLLWFFFSGCGISFEGEDYLIPIDGDVADLPNTCISIRQLYQQFNDIGVNALVFLDANRSIHLPLSSGIGEVTTKLAQDYQVPTFLSCQSHEFSHEDAGLGHGLFTTALLEALNYHPDLNLGTIDTYLTSRLAELSEHHWKPLQTPVSIVPTTASIHRPVFSATTQGSISNPIPAPTYTPPAPPVSVREDIYAPYIPPIPIPIPIVSPNLMGSGEIVLRSQPKPNRRQIPHWASVGFLMTLMIAAGGGVLMLVSQSKPDPQPMVKPVVNNLTVPVASNTVTVNSDTVVTPSQIKTLARANDNITPGDATSYFVAIRTAQKFLRDNPSAAIAVNQSIDKWSIEIATIAEGYARKEKWKRAIGTAIMVPETAANYQTVQLSVASWKQKLP
jgi:Caspase domain